MIPSEAIEQTPDVAGGSETGYVRGIAKLGERLIILLDLEGLFGPSGAEALGTVAA
jgi:purine-binding chemotaxis protein CheW